MEFDGVQSGAAARRRPSGAEGAMAAGFAGVHGFLRQSPAPPCTLRAPGFPEPPIASAPGPTWPPGPSSRLTHHTLSGEITSLFGPWRGALCGSTPAPRALVPPPPRHPRPPRRSPRTLEKDPRASAPVDAASLRNRRIELTQCTRVTGDGLKRGPVRGWRRTAGRRASGRNCGGHIPG